MADGKKTMQAAPVLFQQPFPAILPAPVPSSAGIDDDEDVQSGEGLNHEFERFDQTGQSLNLPSVLAIPPPVPVVAASPPANPLPSSGTDDVIPADDDDVLGIVSNDEPTLNQPSVVPAIFPSVAPSSGVDANKAQCSIDQNNEAEVGHANQILPVLLRQPPLLAILPAPAPPASIQVDDHEDLPNVGLNLEIGNTNNTRTSLCESSMPAILPAAAIPSSSRIDDGEDLPTVRPIDNIGQNINDAIVRTPGIRQQPAHPSTSSGSTARPSTLSYLRGDIDDEEFDNYFRNESQWQKDYGTSSYDDVMCTVQEQPVVPLNAMDKLFEEMPEFDKECQVQETDAIMTPMLCHQRMALSWMIKRENSEEMAPFWQQTGSHCFYNRATLKYRSDKPMCMKGGILADDMGLGKTLVTIALILSNHLGGKPMFAKKNRKGKPSITTHENGTEGSMPTGGMTAESDPVMQIRKRHINNDDDDDVEEVKCVKFKKKKEGYLKPKKTKNKDMKEPGFQFRQFFLSEIKKKGKESDKSRRKSKKRKMKEEPKVKPEFDVIVFSDSDDENDICNLNKQVASIVKSPSLKDVSTQRLQPSGQKDDASITLIICPMSVLSNWTDQFQQHVDPGVDLNLYLYYGGDRVKDINYIKQQDVVLTTYNTLSSDFRSGTSPLHEITWLRIVLDEGHVIRNARSSQSIAAVSLNAKRRWVLTGTPIQNRMADLWTVLKFLKFEPFTDRTWWQNIVLAPMRNRTLYSYNRLQKLMKHLSIRRMKTDIINGRPIVELPAKRLIVEEIELQGEQKRQYEAMQNDGKLKLCRYLKRGIKYVLKHYANILVIIMRLRQLCCHPRLCQNVIREIEHAMEVVDRLERWRQQDKENQGQGENVTNEGEQAEETDADEEKLIEQLMEVLAAGDSEECSICLDNLNNAVITRCAHVFCMVCITDVIESDQLDSVCPLCRSEISKDQLIKVPEKPAAEEPQMIEDVEQHWESSAKVDALMNSLEEIRSQDPSVKCIVVSQFTSFLNLIQIPLRRARFKYTRIDGGMRQQDRANSINDFNSREEDTPTIMLLSLNAGGVGLTLTTATKVFLMDPAWNPATEEQCFDRCHRLGQTKDVTIVKYVVKDSIEERMMSLQERKRELMKEAFGSIPQTNEQRIRGRVQELRTLIGLD